jgi:hypothetical protein
MNTYVTNALRSRDPQLVVDQQMYVGCQSPARQAGSAGGLRSRDPQLVVDQQMYVGCQSPARQAGSAGGVAVRYYLLHVQPLT